MKNLIVTLLSAMMIVCLVGCGGKPSNMDETTYKLGCKALETMEACNNMEISEDEARDILDGIYTRLKDMEYSENESSEELKNMIVRDSALAYQIHLTSGSGMQEDTQKLKKALNK